jgi:cell division protein FtsN
MSKNGNSRAAPGKGMSLLAALLIGMVLGLAVAGGVAWYILKTPSPFVNTEPREQVKLEPDEPRPAKVLPASQPEAVSAVADAATAPASGAADAKPRFEFYKVLTDKPDAMTATPAQTAAKPDGKADKKEAYFLQAGAFASADDADRLKAKLAMLGVEASVQAATLPDKTVWHRVRLGPYTSQEEMNKTVMMLKQNGVTATPMRTQ